MEEEICQYNKFGFCRYRSDCKKKHYKSECEHLDDCNTQKKTVQKDTQKGAENMTLEIVGLKVIVLTNTYNQKQMKIINS